MISNLRLVRGMIQQELAGRAQHEYFAIAAIGIWGARKSWNLSLKSVLALANALGVNVEELD